MAMNFKRGAKVVSKITNSEPGLTKGKSYKALQGGFWQGVGWISIINDRGEKISIMDATKYLKTDGLK